MRRVLFLLMIILCILLVVFSVDALAAAKDGLKLFSTAVLPALFPFFVCTSFLQRLGALSFSPKKTRFFKKLGIPQDALPMMALSAISGAPTGARLAAPMMENGSFTPKLATRYAAVFNLASPMFLTGTLAAGMLKSTEAALPIAFGQYASCILMVLLFGVFSPAPSAKAEEVKNAFPPLQPAKALVAALWDGVNGMLRIGASIVFFLVLIRILQRLGVTKLILLICSPLLKFLGIGEDVFVAIFSGMLEMTSGCSLVSELTLPLRLRAALCCGLITFGGVCLLLQSLSFCDLNVPRYLLIKLVQAILASLAAYFTAPWFLPDAVETFVPPPASEIITNLFSGAVTLFSILFGLLIAWLFAAICKKRMRDQLRIR